MNVIGSPSIGKTKIASPKLRNRFRVVFCDDSGTQLSYGPQLSLQVTKISDIFQSSYGGVNDLEISFEDDVDNLCCEGLQTLFNESSFMMKIELLDASDAVKRTFRMTGCSVIEIQHGLLDYEDGSSLTKDVLFTINGMKIS